MFGPLDFTALDYIGGEGFEHSFFAEVEAEDFHTPGEPSLTMTDFGETFDEALAVHRNRGQSESS